jgi:hypothetical protein
MGGFFKRVFNKDGVLLNEPCPYSIAGIRQVCRFFKKLKRECLPRFNRRATQHFVDVESELRRMTSQVERKDVILDKISGLLWSQVFPEPSYLDFVCHHGPGVTADRYLANARYRIRKWNQRSEYTFPSDLHCYPNYGAAAEGARGTKEGGAAEDGLAYLELRDELAVRVVFVPKTATTPRVIAIEPSHMQYMQQSIKDYCYATIETHALTRNSIRFSDQTPNQMLAHRASKDRRLATLDLKDASDRVHLHLVQRIFKNSGLLDYLEDARSLHATLPDGRNLVLFKYASMGSALCFPVEAMVFYTLIQSIMHTLDGIRPSSRSIKRYSRKIDIYGDDIIVPVEYADAFVNYLESYALKVNVSKSFKAGAFRESCGADFYNGVPVNPVYARMEPHDDSRRWDASSVMSWNATADLFYQRGQWHVAQVIRDMLRKVVKRTIPRSRSLGSGLFHFSYLFDTNCHYDKQYHCWKQKRIVYDPIKRKDSIDGDEIACLNKWGIDSYLRESRSSNSVVRHRHVYVYAGKGTKQVRECIPDLGHRAPVGDARIANVSLCDIPHELHGSRLETDSISSLCGNRSECDSETTERGNLELEDIYVIDTSQPDLRHLTDDAFGLDFQSSVKRGAFKSKHRWVSLVG